MNWKNAAIQKSEGISDAWEVVKAYAGRIAEWVLFLCMIANIIEILPGVNLPDWMQNTILGIQAVMLDVGGFALSSMADHARSMGNEEAAQKAETTGKFLIGIVILTLSLITIGILYPPAKGYTDGAEKFLLLVRVIMTVVYGHVIHSLRHAEETRVQEVDTLRNELSTERERVSTGQLRLSTKQKEVDTLKKQLDSQAGQMNSRQEELDTLRDELDGKQKELDSLHRLLSTGQQNAGTLQIEVDTLRGLAERKQRELDTMNGHLNREQNEVSSLRKHLSSVQSQLDSEQQKVSSLQEELDTLQAEKVSSQVSTGQQKMDNIRSLSSARSTKKVSTGQAEVDSDFDKKQRIRELLKDDPELSGRAIAKALNCSPTTANKLKGEIEEEQKVS